jgi:transcriptional regulator with GAF, ATPase, and Fis domain
MEAEFFAVDGPLLGERFALGSGDVRIGAAPSAHIRLAEADAAGEHCTVRFADGRFQIVDHRSAAGTYVNGMRITRHCLEPGDQVSICDTVLLYREDTAAPQSETQQHTLLHACSLLFLFRALAMASGGHRSLFADQIVKLIAGMVPCREGVVLLGRDAEELCSAAGEPAAAAPLSELIGRICREGAVVEPSARVVALALYVRGEIAGLLAAWFPDEEAVNLSHHRDTLSAVGTVAAAALENVRSVERLQAENASLLNQLGAGETGMVGESPGIRKLQRMLARVAPQDTPVLILGESGTGKELVARALHKQSARASKPFVAINCAALTETLLESELFGHEKGAFTGAVVQKKGKLETAQGGTVFLDEIGELPVTLQAKLLRVLQEREFERVGGTKTLKLDIRLLAATNRDLAAEARRGTFREDLFHRLNVVALSVPPLRDRRDDIPALARHFLNLSAARCRRRVAGISLEAETCLVNYSWPGNIRELENAIERAVVLGQSDNLLPEDLPETVLESASIPEVPGALQSSIAATKRQAIMAAWREAGGVHDRAADLLNLHPNSLRRLIRTLKLRDVLG